MGVNIEDNKLVIITEPKNICFDLPKVFRSNLKHKIDFVLKLKEALDEHTLVNEISWLFSEYKPGNNTTKTIYLQ